MTAAERCSPVRASRSAPVVSVRPTRRRRLRRAIVGDPGRVSVHARRAADACIAAGSGRCASTRASARRAETNERFRHLLEAGQTGLSVAFDLPTQMGIDSDSPRALGEVGRVGVAIDTVDDMHALLDGIPLDTVSTSMTINATAATLLAMYIVVAEERGIRARQAERHDPERHPQGVHRARHVHLSARRRASRSSPTCSGSAPRKCRTGIRSRSPATTFAKPARRRCRSSRSRSPTRSSTCSARVDAGLADRRLRAAAVVLLRRAQRPVRGSREVPRGAPHVRAPHARAVRRERRELPAALPHADRRRHAHRAAAAQQRRARHGAGARRDARRHAVAAHERLRRSARRCRRAEAATLALRTQQIVAYESRRRATPSIRSPAATTSRRSRTSSSAQAMELHRDASMSSVARRRAIERVLPGRDRAQRVRAPAARRSGRDGDRRREPVRRRRGAAVIPAPDFSALERDQVARLAEPRASRRAG